MVPSAWYYMYDEAILGRSLELIESAGEELGRVGTISSDVSNEIGSLVSRARVIDALNSAYTKYE